MSLILLMGVMGVLFILFLKGPIMNRIGLDNKFVYKLKDTKWFQNHWMAGMFLFGLNTVFFFLTILLLYLLMHFLIQYVHWFVMLMAVSGSIYAWILINRAWEGTKGNRLKMGAVGSSFYIFLTILFGFWLVDLKPSYPGEDTFMGAIGLVFAIIVTMVASITCFVIVGFSKEIHSN